MPGSGVEGSAGAQARTGVHLRPVDCPREPCEAGRKADFHPGDAAEVEQPQPEAGAIADADRRAGRFWFPLGRHRIRGRKTQPGPRRDLHRSARHPECRSIPGLPGDRHLHDRSGRPADRGRGNRGKGPGLRRGLPEPLDRCRGRSGHVRHRRERRRPGRPPAGPQDRRLARLRRLVRDRPDPAVSAELSRGDPQRGAGLDRPAQPGPGEELLGQRRGWISVVGRRLPDPNRRARR